MLRKILASAVVFLISAGAAFAQSGTVKGTITDQKTDKAILSANVYIQSINKGAATDKNGEFTIRDVPYGTYKLRISFIGYEKKTVSITVDQPTVIVDEQLTQSISQLSGTIVTAYGISESKRSTDFQNKQVSSKEINQVPSTSPAQGLVGKVAGLQINQNGGGIKPNNTITLRGLRSITRNNEPLVVIDGTKASVNAFRDLNSEDIQDINVLKGATSAALYGSDASNGALIVTTKQGNKNGGLNVGIKNTTTWKDVAYMPDSQTKFGQGIDRVYDPGENTNWGPRFDGQLRRIGPHFPADYPLDDQMVTYDYKEDNLKDFYNTAASIKNTLYFSGGGDDGSFYVSVGQNKSNGIVPGDEYEKYTFTANGTRKLGDVTLGVNANYFTDNRDQAGNDIAAQDRPLKWFLINTPNNIPLTRYKDYKDPTSYGYYNNYFNAYYENPYWGAGTNRDRDQTQRLRGNISASWDVIDNINITGRLGINSLDASGKDFRYRVNYDPTLQGSKTDVPSNVSVNGSQSKTINGNIVGKGNFDLTDDIGLDAVLGSSVEMSNYQQTVVSASDLSVPGFFDPSNSTSPPSTSIDNSQNRTFGFFGKAKFNYRQWAYISVTGREDFTSTLPTGDNSYFYPSFGASLILTDAIPSLGDVSWLSFLKVTANNSTVYSDLDPYQTNEVFSQSSAFPLTTNGFYLQNTAIDKNIEKEKLNSTEFGLNSAFFGGRLNFDASYYFTKTENLITTISPSLASAASGYLTNIGQLSGSGTELTLGGDVIQNHSFNWNLEVNYTHYEQKVDEIKPGTDEINTSGNSYPEGVGIYAIKGEAYPQLKAVSYQRDDQGRVIVDRLTGVPLEGPVTAQGQTTPKHVFGLNTSFNYEGVTLSATMDYRTGYVYYALGTDQMEFTGRTVESAASNRQAFVFPNSSYEDPNNPGQYIENTSVPVANPERVFWTDQWNGIKQNYVRNGREFHLRTIALNYDLPADLLSKTNVISKLSVGLVARNLLTILPNDQSRFSAPEFSQGGYFSPQPMRSYGFNVNIEF